MVGERNTLYHTIIFGIQVRQKDNLLQNALKDISKMREVTRTIVESGDKNMLATEVGALPISCDSNYFNSYSHFAIHHEMLHVSI